MKKLFKLIGIIVIVAIIGFSFATCSDGNDDTGGGGGTGGSGGGGTGGTGGSGGTGGTGGTGGEGNTNLNSWYVYRDASSTATVEHSIAADGVCTVNVGGTPEKHGVDGVWNAWKINAQINYTAKANTSYIYKFEVWTESGARGLQVQYYDNEGLVLNENINITSTRKTYTINGKKLPKGGQQRVEFQCAHQTGKFHVKMLEIKEYNGVDWNVWRDDSSTATMEYSIAADGVCTVTVGGTPEKYGADGNHWKIKAENAYTGNAGKRYEYKFEAWTQSGTRNLHVEYYCNNDDSVYLNNTIPITTTRKTYTVIGEALPKSGKHFVVFQLADQLGTVHLKMLEIKEYNGGGGEYNYLSGAITFSPDIAYTYSELIATYSGSEIVTFQWKKDGNNVGTSSTTNPNKFTPTEEGGYTVTVSAPGYYEDSFFVYVYLSYLSGTITISPKDPRVGMELTAIYNGSETVTYKWWKSGSTNVGTNSNKYTPTESGNYGVTVSAPGYNDKIEFIYVNNPSLLTLNGNITISPNSPNSDTYRELTATYSGSETVTYQWKKDGSNVGTNSNKYTPTEKGSYTVTVSAPGYNSKSSSTVNVFPSSLSGTIIISPENPMVGMELTATYDGSETVTYQWKKDSTNVGTNSNKYTPTEEGHYSITVSAPGYYSKTSKNIWASAFLDLSGTITINPSTGVTTETEMELTATYSGNEPVSYQWYRKDYGVVGTDSNKFTPTEPGDYCVTVSATSTYIGYNTKTSHFVHVRGWKAVSNSTFGTSNINAIAYGNGKFVAGGASGKMATSTDGVTWTAVSNSTFGTSNIRAIAYGNGKFVAGGDDARMATSTDGVTWTAVSNTGPFYYSMNNSYNITAIAYGNNEFVAFGDNNSAYARATSTDGVTWTGGNILTKRKYYTIAYGNNQFVAGGDQSRIMYKTDSNNSVNGQFTDSNNRVFDDLNYNILAIAYGNNQFIAVGGGGNMAYTSNVTTNSLWTTVSNNTFGTNNIGAIAYGNGMFVAGGSNGKMAFLLDD